MSEPVLILPTSLEYGYVDARIILAVADTDDEDRLPNAMPASGTITLTPLNDKTVESDEEPVIVGRHSVSGTLDSTGRLRDSQGQRGLWVVTGLYSVSYNLTGVSVGGHNVLVTSDHTENYPLHLATAAQPTSGPITPTEYQQLSARIDGIVVDAGGVTTVNGQNGTVVLDAADVGALSDSTPIPSTPADIGAATAAQGARADTAVQPADVTDVIREGDARLTDARTPTSHTHAYADITDPPTIPDPQTLSLTGSDLTLSDGGGTVTLPSGGGVSAMQGGLVPLTIVTHEGLSLAPLGSTATPTARPVTPDRSNFNIAPVTLGATVTIDRLSAEITGAGAAGTSARFAIYTGQTDGRPGAILWDSGDVDGSTLGTLTFTFAGLTLPAGVLWLAAGVDDAAVRYRGWTAQAHTGIGSGTTPFLQPRGFTPRAMSSGLWSGPLEPTFPASAAFYRGHDGWDAAPVLFMRVTGVTS